MSCFFWHRIWDRHGCIRPHRQAQDSNELAGYKLFKDSDCTACHYGPAVGGTSFQKMGLVAEYDTPNKAQGVAGLTGKDADRMKFKLPTPRNVEMTYPYFHHGQAETLEKAVEIMGKLQVGRAYSKAEIADIVAFLKILTGKQPDLKRPILPPSTNDTPKPKPFGRSPPPAPNAGFREGAGVFFCCPVRNLFPLRPIHVKPAQSPAATGAPQP